MPSTPSVHAFTTYHNGLARKLINDAIISYNEASLKVKVLWDTGATGTCVLTDVVEKLSIVPTGKENISTPSGTQTVDTFLVDIVLPNRVEVKEVKVRHVDEIGKQGIGALVGMDIILLGDFAVSNCNSETVFSFRIPSKQKTDYVTELNFQKTIGPKHGKGKRKRK